MKQRATSILLVFFTIFSSCKFSEKQDVVLPENYWGWFAVVYDCECGEDKVIEVGRLQQLIPDNGILLVNYPRSKGILNVDVYHQEKEEKRLIQRIAPGNDKNPANISFSNFLSSGYSFNKISKCAKQKGEHHNHTIVFYRVGKEEEKDDHSLKTFNEKLMKYLSI